MITSSKRHTPRGLCHTAISILQKDILLASKNGLMLLSLSAHLKGGNAKPEKRTGFNKPLSPVVFFRLKIKAVSNRLHSMAGLLGNSKELPFLYVRFFADPFNPAAYALQKHNGRLKSSTYGTTAMSTKLIQQLLTKIEALESKVSALSEQLMEMQSNQITQPKAATIQPADPIPTTKERILRLPEVLRIVGLKKSTIYAKIKQGLFPEQLKITERCSGWLESQVYAFVQSLKGDCHV